MARSADIARQLGEGWRYEPSTRGYVNRRTGETLSRRQADVRFGTLATGGFRSYEQKAAARRAAGEAPRPARGRPGPRPETEQKFYATVSRVLRGESLTRAARAEQTTPATVKRENVRREALQPVPRFRKDERGQPTGQPIGIRRYFVQPHASTPLLAVDGTVTTEPQVDAHNASLLGSYWNAYEAWKRTGDASQLEQFRGVPIYTLDGASHELLTDPNAIYAVLHRMSNEEGRHFSDHFYAGKRGPIYDAA